ncbi:FecR family protein [Paludibacter sp.]
MKGSQVKNIVQKFFSTKVSENTFMLFAKWFRLDENQIEKDISMEMLWKNSPSVINEQTLEDWTEVKKRINKDKNIRDRQAWLRTTLSYAAVIALIIASTIFLTYKFAVPASLEYAQLSVSYGESNRLTLPDGTQVVINAGSTLIYPKDFTSETRTVFLSGEANFNVTKNPKKPFIVKTKYIDIEALGTKFHVQAYPNSKYTKASLIEGSIKVAMESNPERSHILKPNVQFVYSHSDDRISIVDVDAAKLASWEDGYLIFQEASFRDIVQILERKYNVEINYDEHKFSQQSYYVKFNPDESLSEIMDVLTMLIHRSSYKIRENKVYFYTK